MRTLLCALLMSFMVLSAADAWAQSKKDTLTATEKHELAVAYRNSCFGRMQLADSCSRVKDSIGAGKFLTSVNPFYFFTKDQTPASIDTYLQHNYLIPADTRNKYVTLFSQSYGKPRSKAFDTFRAMCREDQKIRKALGKCTDETKCMALQHKMRFTDSIHFTLLMKYVHHNGWPTLENGGTFASLLALHDHTRHRFYFPFIKRAVMTGDVDISVLELLLQWKAMHGGMQLEHKLAKYHHVRFDMSEILQGKTPEDLTEIFKVVAANCPVEWQFAVEWSKNSKTEQAEFHASRNSYGIHFKAVNNAILPHDCKSSEELRSAIQTGLWHVNFLYTQNDSTKLGLYIIYGDEIMPNDLDVLFTDSTFITHAINFANNSAEILPESFIFLNELVQWLKSKPIQKIEIAGHTDDVGKPQDNLKLSENRANTVKEYLVKEGISAGRIATKGYGTGKPIESNISEQGKAVNRRVEFRKL